MGQVDQVCLMYELQIWKAPRIAPGQSAAVLRIQEGEKLRRYRPAAMAQEMLFIPLVWGNDTTPGPHALSAIHRIAHRLSQTWDRKNEVILLRD